MAEAAERRLQKGRRGPIIVAMTLFVMLATAVTLVAFWSAVAAAFRSVGR